ncbi:protein kinase [Gemmatimonadota bacterium]
MIGRTISHYKIVDKLGEGGMGAVYKAEDTTLNRLVALKTLSQHLSENDEARERFVREAQAASAINHPNITTVFELLEEDDSHYISMEYVDGKTIRDMVESGHVSIRKAVDIILQAAEALSAAHRKGILHRDVKSANIMVSMEGNVKVMDFGLAHLEERSKLTRTGTTMGTLAYSSPEQLTGNPYDARSEIWSLGVVFYELLTGELPFKSPSEGELLFAIINNEQDSPNTCREDAPESVCGVITRMLLKQPELRYQNCGELIGDLKAIQSEMETTTVQISTAGVSRTKKKVLTLSIASAVVIVGAVLALILGSSGPRLDPNRIVVDVIENRTGDESLDIIGIQAAEWIARGIDETQLVGVVPFDASERELLAIEESGSSEEKANPLRAIARVFNAGIAITGALYPIDEVTIEFQLNIQDQNTGEYLQQISAVRGSPSNRLDLIAQLRTVVLGALAPLFDQEFSSFAELTSLPPSTEAFKEWREGLRDYYRGMGQTTRMDAIQHFYRASKIDSTYLTPLVWAVRTNMVIDTRHSNASMDSILAILSPSLSQLTQFERYMVDWGRFNKDGCIDYSQIHSIVVEAEKMAPGTMWSFDAGQVSRIIGHPQEALDYFAKVDSEAAFIRNWTGWCRAVNAALVMVGRHEEALEIAREQRRRKPNRWSSYENEVKALAFLGKIDEILALFEESKRLQVTSADNPGTLLQFHAGPILRGYGYRDEARRVFEIALNWFEEERGEDKSRFETSFMLALYHLERWEEVWVILSEINQENRYAGGYFSWLGMTAVRLGNFDEAYMWSEQFAAHVDTLAHNKHNGRLYQAQLAALLGDREDAVRLLQQALDEGMEHYAILPRHMNFEGIRDYPPFQALFSYFP